jgi:carboxylesterase type B
LSLPAAEGLFHRAIVQSAGLVCPTPAEAAELTDRWLHAVNLRPETSAQLFTLPRAQLVEAQRAVATPGIGLPGSASMGPVTGGEHFSAHPLDPSARMCRS